MVPQGGSGRVVVGPVVGAPGRVVVGGGGMVVVVAGRAVVVAPPGGTVVVVVAGTLVDVTDDAQPSLSMRAVTT